MLSIIRTLNVLRIIQRSLRSTSHHSNRMARIANSTDGEHNPVGTHVKTAPTDEKRGCRAGEPLLNSVRAPEDIRQHENTKCLAEPWKYEYNTWENYYKHYTANVPHLAEITALRLCNNSYDYPHGVRNARVCRMDRFSSLRRFPSTTTADRSTSGPNRRVHVNTGQH